MIFRSKKEKILKEDIETGEYLKKIAVQLSKGLENQLAIDNKTEEVIRFAKEMISSGDVRPLTLLIQAASKSHVYFYELSPYFRELGKLFFDFHKALLQHDIANLQNIDTWISFYINAERLNEFSHYLEKIDVSEYEAAQILKTLLLCKKKEEAKAWIGRLKTWDIADSRTGRNLAYQDVKEMMHTESSEIKAALDQLENELAKEDETKIAEDLLKNLVSGGMRKDVVQNYIQCMQEAGKLKNIELSDITQRIVNYLKWTQSKRVEDWAEFKKATQKSELNIGEACELLLQIPPEKIELGTVISLIKRCFAEYIPSDGSKHWWYLECLGKIVEKSKNSGFSYKFSDKGEKCNACNGSGVVGANYDAPLERDTYPGYPCADCSGDGGKRKIKISVTSPKGKISDWDKNTSYRFELSSTGLREIFE